jgi:hypothetical protein
MTWIVHIHDGAARQLKAIPPDRRDRILDDIAVFEGDPFRGLVKPMKGKATKATIAKFPVGIALFSNPCIPLAQWKCSPFFCGTRKPTDDRSSRGLAREHFQLVAKKKMADRHAGRVS